MSYKSENWKEKLEQVRNHIALKEGSVEKSADDILNDQIEESLNSIEEDVVDVQEVTDKEINAVKKLSKLIEKAKKDYFKIAKMGDKTLKDTKFNDKYESILKAQQEILSLIGELSNQKMMQKEGVETLDEKSKDVRKRYRGKEQKSVNSLIMQNGVDKIQKLFDDEPKEFDALIGRLAKLESVQEETLSQVHNLTEKPYDDKDVKNVEKLEKKLEKMLKEVDKTMRGSGLSAPAFSMVRSGIVKGLESIKKFYKIANTIPMKESNLMDTYRQMWEDTIVEKKEMNPKVIEKIAKLTDRNDHNESLLLLAKELRDKEAVKLLGNIKDMHKVYGHMPQELIGLRNAIYDNLMRQSKDKFDNHKDVYGAL